MNMTIKKLFSVLLMISAVSSLYAQNSSPAVDLSVTISSLADAVTSGRITTEAGTAVVLNGTVIDRRLINSEKETFFGELTMASGKWIGTEKVVVSKCIVQLEGPQFFETIPAGRSRTVNPDEITLNSEVLVYGVFLGYAETPEGPIAVISAGGVRKL
jgi:hypothetical protein